MHRPSPGQVLFYPEGQSPAEILMPYGVTAFACICGPLSGNHFLTIGDGDGLREMERRVVWEGAQDITFDILPDRGGPIAALLHDRSLFPPVELEFTRANARAR